MPKATFNSLYNDISNGKFSPLYFLYGEEEYFIDRICEILVEKAIPDFAKSFNQHIVYGKDVDLPALLSLSRGFPMMGERQLVLVKEAQQISGLNKKEQAELLSVYSNHPQTTTVLVFAHKHKSPDKRQSWFKTIEKNAVCLESEKIKDYKLAEFVAQVVAENGFKADTKTIQLLVEHIGNDLPRIFNELQKLKAALDGKTSLSPDDIYKYVGISKEYNVFEFVTAVTHRNHTKAQQISFYFSQNPKSNPLAVTLSRLTDFFSKILLVHSSPSLSDADLASMLRVAPFFVKDYRTGAKNYPYPIAIRNLSYLREAYRTYVGLVRTDTNEAEITKELLFKLMS